MRWFANIWGSLVSKVIGVNLILGNLRDFLSDLDKQDDVNSIRGSKRRKRMALSNSKVSLDRNFARKQTNKLFATECHVNDDSLCNDQFQIINNLEDDTDL
jgi:hypothetical protein